MRISDWSSDVCSSDLPPVVAEAIAAGTHHQQVVLVADGREEGAGGTDRDDHQEGVRIGLQPLGDVDAERRHQQRRGGIVDDRSEEHTSELQSLMRISYAVFCLKKKK